MVGNIHYRNFYDLAKNIFSRILQIVEANYIYRKPGRVIQFIKGKLSS